MDEKTSTQSAHMSSHDRKLLFGGWDKSWEVAAPSFRAVDDRIRGGSSTSHLVAFKRINGLALADFWGHLDTKTLGGAGFASQACTKQFNLSDYDGIELVVLPSKPRTPSSPTRFTLNLKTELGGRRTDGRLQSTVSYEYEFEALPDSAAEELDAEKGPYDTRTLRVSWKDFKPFYRGKPKDDAEPLDPSNIQELSIMCRSNFDTQSGDFNLYIVEIAAYKATKHSTAALTWWDWLQSWFWRILALARSGDGHVKL